MKIFKWIFVVLLIWLPLSAQSNQCFDLFSLDVFGEANLSRKGIQPVRLNDQDVFWSSYSCEQCTRPVSSNPTKRKCDGCGKPHTNENLQEIAPATFIRSWEDASGTVRHAMFLVDAGALTRDQGIKALAGKSDAMECPFCGVSDYRLDVQCKGCGVELQNLREMQEQARAILRRRKGPTPSEAFAPIGPAGAASLRPERGALAKVRRESGLPGDVGPMVRAPRLSRRLLGTVAAATLSVATAAGVVWGQTSYTKTAEVVRVTGTKVFAEYDLGNGLREDIVFVRQAGEIPWRVGEQVELYFVNWKLGEASGAERGNGDLLTPREE